MRRALIAPLLAIVLLARAAAADDAKPTTQPFELKDGDHVAFVGGTFFELEAKSGYIETALTTHFPDRNVTFRNFGYAGDTVTCDARNLCAGWTNFGPPDQGFNRLKALIAEFKPTVIFVAYGMTESFDGEKGLPAFVQNYQRLVDMLRSASGGGPRFVFVSPNYHEDLGPPLPQPGQHNEVLKRYSDAVRDVAQDRGQFVDLFTTTAPELSFVSPQVERKLETRRWTADGIHLTPWGYWCVATVVNDWLGEEPRKPVTDVDLSGTAIAGTGVAVANVRPGRDGGLSFSLRAAPLPRPPKPPGVPASLFGDLPDVTISGLPEGKSQYVLKAGDQRVASAQSEQRRVIFSIESGPVLDQAEQLRTLIVAKNADFFNYWRPENDTYILGYRKKEQGRNAVEMPQFKALAEAKDAEIAKLRVPKPVTYTLEREK